MKDDEIINLYQCFHCHKQQYKDRIDAGIPCSCGSMRYRMAQPTPFARLQYCLHTHGLFRGMFEFFMAETLPPKPEPNVRSK